MSSELAKRQEWIQNFDSISGLGRTLQERLIDADRAQPSNWLDDAYWLRIAYHSWRVPLPINSNWWLLCAHDANVPKNVTDSRPAQGEFTNWQVRRAAVMAVRLMDFKERLDRFVRAANSRTQAHTARSDRNCYQIPPVLDRSACINILGSLLPRSPERLLTLGPVSVFGITRVPAVPNDHFKYSPSVSPNSHAIVIVKDQIFSLNMKGGNGKIKSKDDIEKALWLIIKDVRIGNQERSLPIGVLTGANRDSWTQVRFRK